MPLALRDEGRARCAGEQALRLAPSLRKYASANFRTRLAAAVYNDRKVKSQQLVYKPALNFTGDDQFEVQTLYANGQVVEYSYHVKVVGPSKGGRADIRP